MVKVTNANMRFILLSILLISSINAFTQVQWNMEAGIGTSFGKNHTEHEKKNIVSSSLLLNSEIPVYKAIYTEIGLGVIAFSSRGTYRMSSHKIFVLRPDIHVLIGIRFPRRLQLASGFSFSNNRDFKHIKRGRHDNFRTDFNIKAKYSISEKWAFVLGFKQVIKPLADIYFLGTPKSTLLIGLQYNLKK